MGVAEILAIITGVFKFWDETVWFIKFLQKTPQEKHAALIEKMQKEAETIANTNRPTWD